MNSKRSAKRSRRSQDFRKISESGSATDDWKPEFNPRADPGHRRAQGISPGTRGSHDKEKTQGLADLAEVIAAFSEAGRAQVDEAFETLRRQADEASEVLRLYGEETAKALADTIRKAAPWFGAAPRIREVTKRAMFPRSIAGKYQADKLARCIFFSNDRRSISVRLSSKPQPTKGIPTAVEISGVVSREGKKYAGPLSKFLEEVAERLEHLENFKPTIGDYAVEALQNAFVGLMESKYEWGKKGLPTKVEVREMAKELLKRAGKEKRSGWTDLFRTAGLDFLPRGSAGRKPSRQEVDQNIKAKQEAISIVTKLYAGDWVKFRDNIKPAVGGKKLYQQDEMERL
jgi:hypothetical protein